MELGLGFDNEDYDCQEKNRNLPLQSYNAKVCQPLWFEEETQTDNHDREHASNVLRLQGDHAYSLGDFQKAYAKYCEALDLGTNSNAVQRHFMESKTRCLLHLKRYRECREAAQLLVDESHNSDQERQAQQLLYSVCLALQDFAAAEAALQWLITSEPCFAQFWLQLADVYQGMQSSRTGAQLAETADTEASRSLCPPEGELHSMDAASSVEKDRVNQTAALDPSGTLQSYRNCSDEQSSSLVCSGEPGILDVGRDVCSVEGSRSRCGDQSSPAASSCLTPGGGGSDDGGDGDCENIISDALKAQCLHGDGDVADAERKDASVRTDAVQLKELTCLIRARVLLRLVGGAVGGFVRTRNQALVTQIQERIEGMGISPDVVEKAQQLLGRDLKGEEGRSGDGDSSQPQGKVENSDFEALWFSWVCSLER